MDGTMPPPETGRAAATAGAEGNVTDETCEAEEDCLAESSARLACMDKARSDCATTTLSLKASGAERRAGTDETDGADGVDGATTTCLTIGKGANASCATAAAATGATDATSRREARAAGTDSC